MLKHFKIQPSMLLRQVRWFEYLSHFDYKTIHIKGKTNTVMDRLSRYFEDNLPGEVHIPENYINVDVRLDLSGDHLPTI